MSLCSLPLVALLSKCKEGQTGAKSPGGAAKRTNILRVLGISCTITSSEVFPYHITSCSLRENILIFVLLISIRSRRIFYGPTKAREVLGQPTLDEDPLSM
jgi:hypothetical protein